MKGSQKVPKRDLPPFILTIRSSITRAKATIPAMIHVIGFIKIAPARDINAGTKAVVITTAKILKNLAASSLCSPNHLENEFKASTPFKSIGLKERIRTAEKSATAILKLVKAFWLFT